MTPDDPSSEIAGEMAAALASASIALRPTDAPYADKLVLHAKEVCSLSDKRLYCLGSEQTRNNSQMQVLAFGLKHQGTYMDSELVGLKDHGKHYPSSNYDDELAWGALWLYFATGVRRLWSSCMDNKYAHW